MDEIYKELDAKIYETLIKLPEEDRKEVLWSLYDSLKQILGPDVRYFKLTFGRD